MNNAKLLVDNLGLIAKVAKNYYTKVKYLNIEYEDLYQIACLFVWENIDRYDVNKGELSTFIAQYSRYAILNYLKDNATFISAPREIVDIARKLKKENDIFYMNNNRYMNIEELKDYLYPFFKNTSYMLDDNLAKKVLLFSRFGFNGKYISLDEEVNKEIEIPSDLNIEEQAINNVFFDEIISYLNNSDLKEEEINTFVDYLTINSITDKVADKLALKYSMSRQNVYKRINKVREKIKTNIM